MPDVGDWRHTSEPLQKFFGTGKPEMAQVNAAEVGDADGDQCARRDLLERGHCLSIQFLYCLHIVAEQVARLDAVILRQSSAEIREIKRFLRVLTLVCRQPFQILPPIE